MVYIPRDLPEVLDGTLELRRIILKGELCEFVDDLVEDHHPDVVVGFLPGTEGQLAPVRRVLHDERYLFPFRHTSPISYSVILLHQWIPTTWRISTPSFTFQDRRRVIVLTTDLALDEFLATMEWPALSAREPTTVPGTAFRRNIMAVDVRATFPAIFGNPHYSIRQSSLLLGCQRLNRSPAHRRLVRLARRTGSGPLPRTVFVFISLWII